MGRWLTRAMGLTPLAELRTALYLNAATRECYVTAAYTPLDATVTSTSPELWLCAIICLYTESQVAILPNQIREAILTNLANVVNGFKTSEVYPTVGLKPVLNCEQGIENRIELLLGKTLTVMSHPSFKNQHHSKMPAEALIGLLVNNLISYPYSQMAIEGQRGYTMLLDIALNRWSLKHPSRLGGTWNGWNKDAIIDAACTLGWNAQETWANWLAKMRLQ